MPENLAVKFYQANRKRYLLVILLITQTGISLELFNEGMQIFVLSLVF